MTQLGHSYEMKRCCPLDNKGNLKQKSSIIMKQYPELTDSAVRQCRAFLSLLYNYGPISGVCTPLYRYGDRKLDFPMLTWATT